MSAAVYARAAIDDDLGRKFESMRRQSNGSEYGVAHFERAEVERAIGVASDLLEASRRPSA